MDTWLFKFWGVTSRPPWTFFCAHTFVHICWLYCQKWDFWVIGNKFFNFSNYRGMDFSVAGPVNSLLQILTDVWNGLPFLHAGRGTVVPVCNSVFPGWHTESHSCRTPLQAPAQVICPSFQCVTCLWLFWTCWLLFGFFKKKILGYFHAEFSKNFNVVQFIKNFLCG